MSDPISQTQELSDSLKETFQAVRDGHLDSPRLKAHVAVTLSLNGLAPTLPAKNVYGAIEPLHTGLIVAETSLVIQSMEQMMRRMRLLLKSPKAILPPIEMETESLFHAAVPFSYQTSGSFLRTAAEDVSGKTIFAEDISILHVRHESVREAHASVERHIRDDDMSFPGYEDMSDNPRQDYAQNTEDLMQTHLEIANTNLTRLGLRITQAYLWLNDPVGVQALEADPGLKERFNEGLTLTENGFARTDIYLRGAELGDGQIYGAEQYRTIRRAYMP